MWQKRNRNLRNDQILLESLTAASLPEIRDRTELRVDWPPPEPAVVEVLDGLLGVLLAAKLDVHVADLEIRCSIPE